MKGKADNRQKDDGSERYRNQTCQTERQQQKYRPTDRQIAGAKSRQKEEGKFTSDAKQCS